jgi:putative Holliday junction resolvase
MSTMRILAVDPGEKNLGLALSDPSGTIANPLGVIRHVSRQLDAAAIAELARDHQVGCIVVGQALNADDRPTMQSRRAARLAAALRLQIDLPIELWDESGSTQEAQAARRAMGVARSRRAGHLDELAAVVILQAYLEAHRT